MLAHWLSGRSRQGRSAVVAVLGVIGSVVVAGNLCAQSASFERPPINYLDAESHDAVAMLAADVASGKVKLEYDARHGYLPAVLEALDVPRSSQTLVFSKTSLQLHCISPRQPRSLYFNDHVYVGWCQRGDVLELAATDAKQGAIFYTLDQSTDGPPNFVRDRGQCLTCHASSRTQNVPGYLVRSVFSDAAGRPILGSGTFTTDHTSPFKERWGGWYVTGTHGEMRHMGNVTCGRREGELDREAGANVQDLDEHFAVSQYLTPHSDIVALMVLEHQSQTHNAIAFANYEARQALHQNEEMNVVLERPADYRSDSTERRLEAAAERVLEHLLMCGEFGLTSPVKGTSGFEKEFVARGARDSRGRSLRDFELQSRLFRYPCSYLIQSEAFSGLPDEVRSRILGKLIDVLTGKNEDPKFAHITPQLRREILEILSETHHDPKWGNAPYKLDGA